MQRQTMYKMQSTYITTPRASSIPTCESGGSWNWPWSEGKGVLHKRWERCIRCAYGWWWWKGFGLSTLKVTFTDNSVISSGNMNPNSYRCLHMMLWELWNTWEFRLLTSSECPTLFSYSVNTLMCIWTKRTHDDNMVRIWTWRDNMTVRWQASFAKWILQLQ